MIPIWSKQDGADTLADCKRIHPAAIHAAAQEREADVVDIKTRRRLS